MYIYLGLIFGDYLFGWMYVTLSDYIYPTGYFGFCLFPKIFFAVSYYFYFDDKMIQVLMMFALTCITCFINALAAEGLLIQCEADEIVEFSMLDFYTLLYLDVPYILLQSYHGICTLLEGFSVKLFTVKSRSSNKEKDE